MKMNVGPLSLVLLLSFAFASGAQASFLEAEQANQADQAQQIRSERESNLSFKAEDFKAHMLDHPFAGCPVNSACTQKLGQARSFFERELAGEKLENPKALNLFLKNNYLPVPIFVAASAPLEGGDPDFILWDSSCREHLAPGQVIYPAEALINNLSQLDDFPQASSGLVWRARAGKVELYRAPRDHAPRFMNGNEMIFLFEENGRYYNLALSRTGALRALAPPSSKNVPVPSVCPPELEAHFKGLPEKEKAPFHHHFCRSLYNLKTKARETVLVAWSCK